MIRLPALLLLLLLVACDPAAPDPPLHGQVEPDPTGRRFPGVSILDSCGRRIQRVECWEDGRWDAWVEPGKYRVITRGRFLYDVDLRAGDSIRLGDP